MTRSIARSLMRQLSFLYSHVMLFPMPCNELNSQASMVAEICTGSHKFWSALIWESWSDFLLIAANNACDFGDVVAESLEPLISHTILYRHLLAFSSFMREVVHPRFTWLFFFVFTSFTAKAPILILTHSMSKDAYPSNDVCFGVFKNKI